MHDPVSLSAKFEALADYWHPRIVAEVDDLYVKIAKAKGDFVWHTHEDEDEFFLVARGRLTIRMRDRDVILEQGDLFVVPAGVEHQPSAEEETHVLVLERKTTAHTGATRTAMTVSIDDQDWI